MSVLSQKLRHSPAALALAGTLAGCASARPHVPMVEAPSRTEVSEAGPWSQGLGPQERVAHVLSRLTFGARPGDAQRVAAMGVDRWIEAQLRPEAIPDSTVVAALKPIALWSQPVSAVEGGEVSGAFAVRRVEVGTVANPNVVRIVMSVANELFFAGKIVHAQVSERQLHEVVSDFWENHFSVYNSKMPSREAIVVWDRDVLRPRALGKFRDLLGAVAHSPAMLFYLDNHLSRKNGINENYARELLELHTLGVDGGYTQDDVVAVARALTGWTISPSRNPTTFTFRADLHDTGTKVVLGHTLAAGRGIEDGEEVLDILARHPATARFIARKLARRLVSDEPPDVLVARAAETFTRTDGDIAEVVRTIVTSREFFSRGAFRAKVKTPFELIVSARRALNAPVDTTVQTVRLLTQFDQPMFGQQSPDGWPEEGAAWVNSGTILKRITFGADVAAGKVPAVPVERWAGWATLSTRPADRQTEGVVAAFLGGVAEPATRSALLATVGDSPSLRLREMIAVALASPEFQRR